jgi:hypothetical protein
VGAEIMLLLRLSEQTVPYRRGRFKHFLLKVDVTGVNGQTVTNAKLCLYNTDGALEERQYQRPTQAATLRLRSTQDKLLPCDLRHLAARTCPATEGSGEAVSKRTVM